MDVYIVQHDSGLDVKLIGVYSSYILAQEAVRRTMKLPGFSGGEFSIDPYVVDKDYWEEGYGMV